MEFFGKHRLVPHPEMRPVSVKSVEVEVSRTDGFVMLNYAVQPANALVLPAFQTERRDNLWRGTCFELFIRPERRGYVEFNFAPLFAWNAYSFADWRAGRRPFQPDSPPHMVDSRQDDRKASFPAKYELDVILGGEITSLAPARASLAVVIEEEGGNLSYWALAHPSGQPNFHHADCFAAKLA
jgi:hypothetical protein